MATAATKLSARDCKDLEKYLRYLVYKSVQVIVQSRQGEKISVPSKQFSTGVDWFNLTIRDSADVLTEVKRVYPGTTGGLVAGVTVCIETVLRMNNGDAIQLETWYIRMVPETDAPAKISYTVYGRIGTLLKSLLVATRCVPVYRLSRRWGESNSECNICYRVYVGDPVFDLGSAYRSQIVGLVPTPVGTVSLSVAYRTQLSFSPTRQDHTVLEVREDHFCFDQKVVSGSIHIPCRHPVSTCQSDDADAVSEHNMPMLSPSTPDLKKASPTHTNALSVNRHDFSANARC
jgi:autophagy-related protein 13